MTAVQDFARKVPKVDVHCHLTGSVDLDTALELAAQTGALEAEIRRSYDLDAVEPSRREEVFFESLDVVAALLRSPQQLTTAVHRIVQRGVRTSNLRYLELFVNPTALQRTGMSFEEVRDGLVAGSYRAKADFGVPVNFIACFLRDEPLELSETMLDDLIEHRTPEFVGIGLDGPETSDRYRPERFVDLYRRAAEAGFRRTAHFTETAAADLAICLDDLGCDRVDHGYPLIDDPAMLDRAATSGIPFTCCPTITRDISSAYDPRYAQGGTHPIGVMLEHGVTVVIGTDDGALVGTDLGTEYALIADWYGWDVDAIATAAVRSIAATWLDDEAKEALASSFRDEIAVLIGEAT